MEQLKCLGVDGVQCDSIYIINKKYQLCDQCNYKRKHGRSKQEVYQERHNERQKQKQAGEGYKGLARKSRVDRTDGIKVSDSVERLKKKYSIKQISSSRAEIERQLRTVVYPKIDQEREPICQGCGRGDRPLSHSHILSRYHRNDLITDPNNIQLHCMGDYNSCHSRWERFVVADVMLMLDFQRNVDYIQQVDPKVFNKLIAKIEFEKLSLQNIL